MELSELTKQQRMQTAIQVFLLMTTENISQAKACDKVGIDPRTYRRWLAEDQGAVMAVLETIREIERSELVRILSAREAILDHLITKATSDFTDPLTTLQILDWITNRSEILGARTVPENRDALLDVLGGPLQKHGESRFTGGGHPMLEVQPVADGINIRVRQAEVIDISPPPPDAPAV